MKKITRIFAVALALLLLVGAVVGISVSADETPADKWVISANVSYSDDIHPYFAIDASLVEDASLLSVTVNGKAAEISSETVDIYGDGTYAYVVEAAGVVAKKMAQEFPVVVSYDGKIVEESSYSVAQYFYERLYKNGVIKAIQGKDLLRKDLYLSALEYGSLAQTVLNYAGTNVSELIYVNAPGYSGFWNKDNYFTLDAGTYKVLSYPWGADGIMSVVAGGKYVINNSVIVEKLIADPHVVPDSAVSFEDKTAGAYTFAANTTDSVLINHKIQKAGSATTSIAEADGNKYFYIDKTSSGSSSNQTWITIERNAAAGNTYTGVLTFEAKFKIDFTAGNSAYLRFYKGRTAANQENGTIYGMDSSGNPEVHRNIMFNAINGNMVMGTGDDAISLGAKENEWFTLRLVLTSSVAGPEIQVYSSNDEGSLTYRGTISKTGWADLSECTTIVYMNDSTPTLNVGIDDIYFGEELKDNCMLLGVTKPTSSNLGFTFTDDSAYGQAAYRTVLVDVDGDGVKDKEDGDKESDTIYVWYDENETIPVPSFKGTLSSIKDITTNADVGQWFLNDVAKSGGNSGTSAFAGKDGTNLEKCLTLDVGQAIYKFEREAYTGSDNTFVFESDYRITGVDALGHFDIRMRTAKGGVYRTYFGNGQVSLNKTNSTASEKGLFSDGEWFRIKVEYTAVGDAILVRAYVNGALVATNTAPTGESYSGDAKDIINVGLLISKDFIGTLEFKNVKMYQTNVDLSAQ